MSFITFRGEKIDSDSISHQHLSNVYWFNKILRGYPDDLLKEIMDNIKTKFGEILPYKPHPDFKKEIDSLDVRGFLTWNEAKTKADIYYFKELVGEVLTRDYLRDEKINEILDGTL